MEDQAVVETTVDEPEEMAHRQRRLFAVEFEDDVALARLELDVGMGRHRVGGLGENGAESEEQNNQR